MTDRAGALVTGASGNIGSGVAAALLSRGLVVIGVDLEPARADLQCRPDYQHWTCDVQQFEGYFAERWESSSGVQLRHVACIAGGAEVSDGGADGQDIPTMESAQRAFQNNFLGPLATVRAVLPHMDEIPGDRSVTFCSSINAGAPWSRPGYSAAKAAVESLTSFLAERFGPQGIRVNAVVPGTVTDTSGRLRLGGDQLAHELSATVPLGRFATGGDVAEAFVSLMLDLRHVTGTLLRVDGGQDLRRGFPAIRRGDYSI